MKGTEQNNEENNRQERIKEERARARDREREREERLLTGERGWDGSGQICARFLRLKCMTLMIGHHQNNRVID